MSAPPSVIKRLLNTVNETNTNTTTPDEHSSDTTSKITTMATPLPDKKLLEESWRAVEEIINRQQQQTTPAWKIQATPATTTTTTTPPQPPSQPSPGAQSTPGSIKKALAVSFPTSHRVTSNSTDEEGLAATSMVWMKQLADIYDTTTTSTPSTSSSTGIDTDDRQCDTCEVGATSSPVTSTSTISIVATTKQVPVADAPKIATIPSPAPSPPAAAPAPPPVVVVRASTNVPTTKTTPPPSRPPVAPSPTVLKNKQQQQQRPKQMQHTYTTNTTSGLQLSQKLVAFTFKLCIMLMGMWMMITITMTSHPKLGMSSSSSKTHSIATAIRNTVPQGLKNIAMLNTKGMFRNSAPYYQFQQQMWRPWEKKEKKEKNTLVDVDGVLEPSSENRAFVPASVSTYLKKVWSLPSSSSPAFETEQGVKIGFNPVGNSNNNGGVKVEEVEKREIVKSSWGSSKLALSEFHIHVQEVIVAALRRVFNTLGQRLQLVRVMVGQQH